MVQLFASLVLTVAAAESAATLAIFSVAQVGTLLLCDL